jgi:peptide/nickel transport system substrate-binding protein
MNYAIDRKAIAHALYGKNGSGTSQVPMIDVPKNRQFTNYYRYDPKKAKKLLTAAGYPNGFTITVYGGTARGSRSVQAVANYYRAVGIKVKFTNNANDFSSGKADFFDEEGSGAFSTYMYYQFYFLPKTSYFNTSSWRDPVLEQLWIKGAKAPDAARVKYSIAFLKRIVTQAYGIPIAIYDNPWYARKNVGGLTQIPWPEFTPTMTGLYPK